MDTFRRYKLIACEIMFREICYCISKCINIVDVIFMPKGLHDIGALKMAEKLQMEIDKVEIGEYEAILLCYGLCNNGIRGLNSSLPIVIPRAHDCITLLLGSREKYNKYFYENPGTFFKSSGWIERDVDPNDTEGSVTSQLGMKRNYKEYAENYGEENAKYLMDILNDWFRNYNKITYVDTSVGNPEEYKKLARLQADQNNWDYEEIQGDTTLISRLLNGEWDEEDFLIVPPYNKIEPTNDFSLVSYI